MTVTLTDRLGLTRWGSDSDAWSREQIVANFDALEELVVRRGDLVINAADYDVDPTGVADSTAGLVEALAAAANATLLIPPGTYSVTGALDPAGVTVLGHGATLRIPNGTTPGYSVLVPTGGDFTIEGLTVDCNKAGTTNPANQGNGNGLRLYVDPGWANVVLRDFTVRDSWQVGIHIYAPGINDSETAAYCPTLLERVVVTGCAEANFSIKTVAGVDLVSCRSEDGAIGYYLPLVSRVTLTGCIARNNTGAGLFTEYGRGITITGGQYDDNGAWGIALGGGSTTFTENRDITVTGVTCRGNAIMGITVDPTKADAPNTWVASPTSLIGNIIEGNGGPGINIENAGYVTVVGNTIRGNTGTGLRIVGAYVLAEGNLIVNNTTYGIAVYGVTGHDNGHHRFGANVIEGNGFARFDASHIDTGEVLDVITRIPGSTRALGTLHAAADTGSETFIGKVGPSGEAGIDVYGEILYRSAAGVLRTASGFRAATTVHGGSNTGQEVYIGPAGPGGEAAIDVYGEKLYRTGAGALRYAGTLAIDTDVTVGGQSVATDADLNAHINDTTDAHDASAISVAPVGGIAATDAQAALAELDTEKAPKASPTFTGTTTVDALTATGNVLLGNAPTDLIGFYGAAGVARPGTYNLTGSADRTLGAYASDAESAAYAGVPAALADAATRAELNQLRAAYENLRTYVEDLAGVTIATATDLKTLGLVG